MRTLARLLGIASVVVAILSGCANPSAGTVTSVSTGSARDWSTSDTGLVRSVQEALRGRGFDPGRVDGQWDGATEAALRRFQETNRLQATGQLDERTASALGVWR